MTIESDSKISVNALISPGCSDTCRISVLSQDTLRLAALIPNSRFSWIPREANVAAHTLASWSLCNRLLTPLVKVLLLNPFVMSHCWSKPIFCN